MDKLSLLFATPVFVVEIKNMEEANVEVARLLLIDQQKPGLARSNVGGWHSPDNLTERPEPCFQHVIREIAAHVGQAVTVLAGKTGQVLPPQLRWSVQAWAMIMRHGDYSMLHDHGNSHWSTVYYVDRGDENAEGQPLSGVLALVDPRRNWGPIPGLQSASTSIVRPRAGTLVIFPAWLQHFVHPYQGQRPRISISANFLLQGDSLNS